MRLIDAEELKKIVEDEFAGVCVYDVSPSEVIDDFHDIIDKASTVEVGPVRQGHWEESCNELNKYCSECKKVCGTIYEHENYCPNCGAKMYGCGDEE